MLDFTSGEHLPGQESGGRAGGLAAHTVAIPRVIVPTNLHIETVCPAIVVVCIGS